MNLNPTYWQNKWEVGDIGFHQAEVEPCLVKFFSDLTPGTVFVPLCGKSKDLVWLAQKGWTVVGVEASPIACKAFFIENELLTYQIHKEADFSVYKASDINIWCGDFFKVPQSAVAGVTAIYDRAALIALPPELRPKYVRQMMALLPRSKFPNIQGLLLALEYPQRAALGPPFSVESAEVRELYKGFLDVRELAREEDTILPAKSDKFRGMKIIETVYALSSASNRSD